MAIDFAAVSAYMLDALPPLKSFNRGSKESEDEMAIDEEYIVELPAMDADLEQQITDAINSDLLAKLVNVVGDSLLNGSHGGELHNEDVSGVGAICAFLHTTFNTLPVERIMPGLAYRTMLVPMLWKFMKLCHESRLWPSLSDLAANLPGDAPGWLLPLAVFCPVYKHMLMIVDNEEFYEQEKPLSSPGMPSNSVKPTTELSGRKKLSLGYIENRVSFVTSELLTQLQDLNNRRQFVVPSDFHALEVVDEYFMSQALIENTRAYDILRQSPFLVPFTSRVKIFTSFLRDARNREGFNGASARNRFSIRRDRIFEDSFRQMSQLSEADLRGVIRVTFVNEFGVEEAGIDGGGIFKDFMENITRAAFNVQYGLFKETADHLLYPNPGSGIVHEKHLEYFHFLGVVLGKAYVRGILVDIPFCDVLFEQIKTKRYEGDIEELELYFVVVTNEYGGQIEEELLPGGKDIRVTKENVIVYIHQMANHHLNYQIRSQSSHFLRGFQQLIEKDWISMFNEHELQLLISGSLEGLNVDDLRSYTHYNGGYDNFSVQSKCSFTPRYLMALVAKQKEVLRILFVTGCSRGPLLGFKHLEPQFCIQRTAADASEEALDRLPTSATCMNLLKLPPYGNKEQLEQKLLYAINAEAGFDLS
ncbi:hypothetical protein IFM89_025212 [Coptis chinensis]|uniref:HECT-type E3 ubiquitin transferase n=1 Tax=Coptis chinensis TaxID=261450 RepID=A0A835H8P4_9MAGN|nr:hypothetical protein IFM89_025212 [Coptis chinensis]